MDDELDTVPGDHTVASTHYWVTIARDPDFTTSVEQAYTPEPCYAPARPMVDEGTLYYWQVVPADDNGDAYNFPISIDGGFIVSPTFQHASVPPVPDRSGRRRGQPGRDPFKWAPVPEQVRNYTIEIAQDDSFSTVLESATTDATAYSSNTIFPVGATTYWRVRANNDDGKGLRFGNVELRADAAGADDHDGDAVRGRHVPGPHLDAGQWRQHLRGAGRLAHASVHVTSNIPSTAVCYTKMTGTGHGTVQVRAVFPSGLRSASRRRATSSTPSPSRWHRPSYQQARQARTHVRVEHEDERQAVQGPGLAEPGFSQTFLDVNTDQVELHAAAH